MEPSIARPRSPIIPPSPRSPRSLVAKPLRVRSASRPVNSGYRERLVDGTNCLARALVESVSDLRHPEGVPIQEKERLIHLIYETYNPFKPNHMTTFDSGLCLPPEVENILSIRHQEIAKLEFRNLDRLKSVIERSKANAALIKLQYLDRHCFDHAVGLVRAGHQFKIFNSQHTPPTIMHDLVSDPEALRQHLGFPGLTINEMTVYRIMPIHKEEPTFLPSHFSKLPF